MWKVQGKWNFISKSTIQPFAKYVSDPDPVCRQTQGNTKIESLKLGKNQNYWRFARLIVNTNLHRRFNFQH